MEKTKASPAHAYKRVRLERARRLVTQTKAPMIEIAVEVGFETASHFSREFREVFGQPPSKFRSKAPI